MCFVRKDFVAGWCRNCCHVSAQMYLQKVCFSTWVGYEQHTSGFHWDRSTERDTYNEGVIPSDSCPYAQAGQDPRYAFRGQPPLHLRQPLVVYPDEAWWGHKDEIPPKHQKGYKQNLPCIRCDPRYGELNFYWFCLIVLTASRNRGMGYDDLYRYFEGLHQSRLGAAGQEPGVGHNLDENRPPECWNDLDLRRKPHTFIPTKDFLRGDYPCEYLDPRDVANRMGFRAQDEFRERLVLEGLSMSEGRCAGGTDDDDGFFDAYPLRNGAFNYLVEANEVYALVPTAEDMQLGPIQTDQHVGFLNGIEYDHTNEELEEIMDDNHREAHRWDRGGYWWRNDGTALHIPPQAVSNDFEPDDTYSDHDPDAYSDGFGEPPQDDLSTQMASVHLGSPEYDQDDEYFEFEADGSHVIYQQQQPHADNEYQNAVEYDGCHLESHSEDDDGNADYYPPDPSHWHM